MAKYDEIFANIQKKNNVTDEETPLYNKEESGFRKEVLPEEVDLRKYDSNPLRDIHYESERQGFAKIQRMVDLLPEKCEAAVEGYTGHVPGHIAGGFCGQPTVKINRDCFVSYEK